jgi:hypothetical protein
VTYRKAGWCSEKHIKTCGLENSTFLIEFCKSGFCWDETDLKFSSIHHRYKICPVSSSDAKLVTVLRKLLESGFQWTQDAN